MKYRDKASFLKGSPQHTPCGCVTKETAYKHLLHPILTHNNIDIITPQMLGVVGIPVIPT